jgi:hypothetical protein
VRPAPLLLLVAAALLLGGCRFDVASGVVIDRDGSAVVEVALHADADALARLDALGVDPTAELAATVAADPDWELAREGDEDGGLTVRLRHEAPAAAGAADALRELDDGLTDEDPGLLVDLDLEVDDRGAVRAEGTAQLRPPGRPAVTLDDEAVGPDADELAALTEQAVSARFALTTPGSIERHDADRVEGRTATWELPAGEPRRVSLQATAPNQVPLVVVVAAGAALVVLLVAIGWWWRRRRR